ncbi:MAG: metallophosphoesterase [Nocardioidaceae bacterium]
MGYVTSDVHGHRAELLAALASAGLVDAAGEWSGGDETLWFLGDFLDRGPDGVGVIDSVMRMQRSAETSGGAVRALLGNHEVLALGMHKFGDAEVPTPYGRGPSFAESWLINGGQADDQERLTDEHLRWLRRLPAMARLADDLLMHSDSLEYLAWGDDVEAVNARVAAVLGSDDLAAWWELWARLTTRHAFLGLDGSAGAAHMLSTYGGRRIVHGHSIIGDMRGVESRLTTGPYEYADGLALAVDGGIYDGGPCLVVDLATTAT